VTDFPEPIQWNGSPEDDDGYIRRSTGPRAEPPALCYGCGEEMAGTFGPFCSALCRAKYGAAYRKAKAV